MRNLLRRARPEPALPPRFRESVWRRIERTDLESDPLERGQWLERWVTRLLRPRLAVAGVMAVVLLGGTLGAMNGVADARQAAQDRYVSSVAPHVIR